MKILLVEDHPDLAGNIGDYLMALGHDVDFADNGKLGLQLAIDHIFDAIILDVNLPHLNGFDMCRKLRDDHQSETPVLMLTARGSLADKTTGFQSGALDYLVKPFALEELKLRLDALMMKVNLNQPKILIVGELKLDVKNWQVSRAGNNIDLHKSSIQLLELLMRSSPHVVSRQELEYVLWGDSPPLSNPLRSHMHALRKAIDKPFEGAMLHTVKGVGFKLIEPQAS